MKRLVLLIVALAIANLSKAADPTPSLTTKVAVFAGGCFWCIQTPFDKAKGVVQTVVGYTGGTKEDATYEKVSAQQTKHREALQVTYDPAQISYEQLLDIYWHQIDPTQADGQFSDIGPNYRAAIYYTNDNEKRLAEESKDQLAKSGKFKKPIVTEILPAMPFYPAEDYHQKYYLKNPADYEAYHIDSGRVRFHEKTWGAESKK